MSEINPKELLYGIVDSIDKIMEYIAGHSLEDFLTDTVFRDKVMVEFDSIGRAADIMPEKVRITFSKINWYIIMGYKFRIALDNKEIDYPLAWSFIQDDLAIFREKILAGKYMQETS